MLEDSSFIRNYVFCFSYRTLWGCKYLIPKVCGLYFIGKGSLVFMKEWYPESYQKMMDNHSATLNKVCGAIVPSDYLKLLIIY